MELEKSTQIRNSEGFVYLQTFKPIKINGSVMLSIPEGKLMSVKYFSSN